MTVKELFEHFSEYFVEIKLFDKTNNICDIVERDNLEISNLKVMHTRFLKEYGEYNVVDWECSAYMNSIYIEIEKEIEE